MLQATAPPVIITSSQPARQPSSLHVSTGSINHRRIGNSNAVVGHAKRQFLAQCLRSRLGTATTLDVRALGLGQMPG